MALSVYILPSSPRILTNWPYGNGDYTGHFPILSMNLLFSKASGFTDLTMAYGIYTLKGTNTLYCQA